MQCPHCQSEAPISQTYCPVCGGELQLSFEKVARAATGEAESQAQEHTVRLVERLLSSGLILLALFGGLAYLFAPAGPSDRVIVPEYPGQGVALRRAQEAQGGEGPVASSGTRLDAATHPIDLPLVPAFPAD